MPNAVSGSGTNVMPNVGPAPGVFTESEVGVTGIKVLCCPINESWTVLTTIASNHALIINGVAQVDFAHERPVSWIGHIQRTSNLCHISPFDCTNFLTRECTS